MDDKLPKSMGIAWIAIDLGFYKDPKHKSPPGFHGIISLYSTKPLKNNPLVGHPGDEK